MIWWTPSAFWFLELVYSALAPYVSISPTTVRIRRWVFVPPQKLPREGLSCDLEDKNSVTFRIDSAKAATVQKVRMDERDWGRFLDVLRTIQEPGPSV